MAKTKQAVKEVKQNEEKKVNELASIYGARLSKDKTRVNVVIVIGEDDNKQWRTISIKLGNSTAKTKAVVKDGYAFLKIPMLEEKPKTVDVENIF